VPIAIPPELTMTWFNKNMPFKDKDFADMKELISDIAGEVKQLEDAPGPALLSALNNTVTKIGTETKKLAARKGVHKDLEKKLGNYVNAGKILVAQAAQLVEAGKSDQAKVDSAKQKLSQLKMALDKKEKLVGPLFKATTESIAKLKAAKDAAAKADATAKAAAETALEKATKDADKAMEAARKGFFTTGTTSWEKWWQDTLRLANPANLPDLPSTPKKEDLEALGKRVVRMTQIRDKLTEIYKEVGG
jgi:chromosome segregation ATPase